MTKVVQIGGGKKRDDEACMCCGHPWHHIMLCPKVQRVELYEDGSLAAVEYFEPDVWRPKE
jgi:hypothetical protein